jgi:glycosyltransferase involved in cell wall biosynthesis
MRRLRVLTWRIHGNYLWYLSQAGHDFYLPVRSDGTPGYGGRGSTFPFGDNVYDVPAEEVRSGDFDCILFQHRDNYERDQYEILSAEQQRLPRIFLQHDPPWESPTNQPHWVDDPNVLLVHCTDFNRLMWDSGRTPTKVIDHGVMVPEHVRYTGELERGIVVVNNLQRRGRLAGADIFTDLRDHVPLDLVGMSAEALGGLGEVSPPQLAAFEARYRFFFNPIRYTSLGLAVLEAMLLGLPIVGLATTELVTVIRNGENGFLETDPSKLIPHMQRLLADPQEARRLGEAARATAMERFNIRRFAREW